MLRFLDSIYDINGTRSSIALVNGQWQILEAIFWNTEATMSKKSPEKKKKTLSCWKSGGVATEWGQQNCISIVMGTYSEYSNNGIKPW